MEEVEAERGLGGRLLTRELPLGGKGKEPILVVFRSVLGMLVFGSGGEGDGPGVSAGAELGAVSESVELDLDCLGVGSPDTVTDREGIAVRFGVEVGSCEAVEARRESGVGS